jgi:hypothetical protein
MTPKAAEELLNIIMLDDFVARREGLDRWSRRWLATMEVTHVQQLGLIPKGYQGDLDAMARAALTEEILRGLLKNELPAMGWATHEGRTTREVVARMHVVLQEPREP